jgi:hypothetical protein
VQSEFSEVQTERTYLFLGENHEKLAIFKSACNFIYTHKKKYRKQKNKDNATARSKLNEINDRKFTFYQKKFKNKENKCDLKFKQVGIYLKLKKELRAVIFVKYVLSF